MVRTEVKAYLRGNEMRDLRMLGTVSMQEKKEVHTKLSMRRGSLHIRNICFVKRVCGKDNEGRVLEE